MPCRNLSTKSLELDMSCYSHCMQKQELKPPNTVSCVERMFDNKLGQKLIKTNFTVKTARNLFNLWLAFILILHWLQFNQKAHSVD